MRSNARFPTASQDQEQPTHFIGTFSDGRVTVTLEPVGGGLVGSFAVERDRYPLAAQPTGEKLSGSFRAVGGTFTFVATLNGSRLMLVSDGIGYALERIEASKRTGTAPARSEIAPDP